MVRAILKHRQRVLDAAGTGGKAPPSEKESGVVFTTPITKVRVPSDRDRVRSFQSHAGTRGKGHGSVHSKGVRYTPRRDMQPRSPYLSLLLALLCPRVAVPRGRAARPKHPRKVPLPQAVARILSDPAVNQAHWGISVVASAANRFTH